MIQKREKLIFHEHFEGIFTKKVHIYDSVKNYPERQKYTLKTKHNKICHN